MLQGEVNYLSFLGEEGRNTLRTRRRVEMEGTKRNYINLNKICLISRFRGYFHMNESNHRQ